MTADAAGHDAAHGHHDDGHHDDHHHQHRLRPDEWPDEELYKKASAENTLEMLAGVEYLPTNYLTLHLGAGAGEVFSWSSRASAASLAPPLPAVDSFACNRV